MSPAPRRPPTPAEVERRKQRKIEEGHRHANLDVAGAVYMLAWGPNQLDVFVTKVWPHHARHVAEDRRLTRERIDAALTTLTALRAAATSYRRACAHRLIRHW